MWLQTRARVNRYIGLVLLIGLVLAPRCFAAPNNSSIIELGDQQEPINLGGSLSYFATHSADLDIKTLLKHPDAYPFIPGVDQTLNFGYSDAYYWIKLSIAFQPNASKQWFLRLIDPLLDSAELYIVSDKNELLATLKAGDHAPLAQRQLHSRSPLFKLQSEPGQVRHLYMKMHSNDPLLIDLRLYPDKAYDEWLFLETLILGAYYGIMTAMLLYNFFIFYATRDRAYFFYCLYIMMVIATLAGFDGLSSNYIWPDYPRWINHSLSLFVGLAGVTGITFAREFLNTRVVMPRFDKVLMAVLTFSVILIPLALLADSFNVVAFFSVIVASTFSASIIFTAVRCYLLKTANARFFLLAWITVVLGILIRVLAVTGQIEANNITLYAGQFGTALEAILLSMALADRIKTIEQEKQQAQQRAADALQRANQELRASNQIKDEFLATISHELRTPMNGIQGMIDLLKGTELGKQQTEYLGYAELSNKEMMKHIESILSFSEAQSQRTQLQARDFHINELIQYLTSEFTQRCDQKFIEFRVSKSPTLPTVVRGDAVHIQRVLYNLLDNGVKFTDAGYVELVVESERHDTPHSDYQITFTVKDSGCGVQKSNYEQLFEPFVQADSSTTRNHGGLGIGLALSKALSDMLGGELTYQENVPKGSIFSFSLSLPQGEIPQTDPIEQGASLALLEQLNPKETHGSSQRPEHLVMVVEDNHVNQQVLAAVLRKRRYRVITADNGEEALNLLNEYDVDIILMDCQMPVMDGYETTRIIRERSDRYGIPIIIAVTANALTTDRDRCLNAGMDDYVSKPVDRYKLYTCIEANLERQTASIA